MRVLDDGFVKYVDHMGDDHAIVQAARTSYIGTWEDKDRSQDERLIRYLMRHQHMTPFEMCILKIAIRIPMDAWRQFVRHRLLSINEYSTRYRPAIDSQHKAGNVWRLQSTDNKQGSGEFIRDPGVCDKLRINEDRLHSVSRATYEQRLECGVAREQARKDLPLSTYTEAIVECDLRGWLHFLGLRLHPHAQREIRQYAIAIASVVNEHWPLAWKAFEDYHLNSITFTACDVKAFNDPNYRFPTKREADEYDAKCRRLRGQT
jgi:thymidylate synthase (FAD)